MISMIIPVYWANDEMLEMTIRCLNSLHTTTGGERPEQVLVVDDGSPMEVELEDETSFKQIVKQLRLDNNRGYAAAVNAGLHFSSGEIIVVCNNDIEFIQHDWLEQLLKPLGEGYDISSIRTTDADGWDTEDRYEEGAKFGSIWAMKRKVYETTGGLSEEFGKGYAEDLDYQKRAEDAGFKVVKNHAGLVHHVGKATFKQIDPEDTAYREAMIKFKKKYGKIW